MCEHVAKQESRMTKPTHLDAITRRAAMVAGGAAALAGTLRARPAAAAAPAAGRQVPGIYRYKVGDFELTAVNDGVNRVPMKDGFIRNAPLTDIQQALEDAYLPKDVLGIPFNQLIVNTGRKVVLIDTGTGGQLAPTAGKLIENMEAAGIDPKSVDTVLISHFHGDHILGLRTAEGTTAFPNAQIFVPEPEWAFWMDEGTMSRAPDAQKKAFENVRRTFEPIKKDVTHFNDRQELVPGITAEAAFGHTPGHMTFRISSGSDQMIALSDTTNHPALFVRNPGWHAAFDMDAQAAEATRRRVLDMVSTDRLPVQGYHFPFPGNGHIAKRGDGYDYIPAAWNPVL
jgi:glyoxylase-like metal-dependent hydrolase (beta-lactamase superfamily II)